MCTMAVVYYNISPHHYNDRENLRPDVLFMNQTSPVTSPVASSPSQTLLQKHAIVFKCGLKLALLIILDPCLPLVRNEPAGDKVVIISIELILAPMLILESNLKSRFLKDDGAKGTSSSRHTRGATINSMSC